MTNGERVAMVDRLAAPAQAAQAKWGVPASITIAQAILESGWGQSQLAVQDNNYFGIKTQQGENYAVSPGKEQGGRRRQSVALKYRRFRSMAESFDRHGELLATLERYQPAMAVADDPLAFAIQLQRCGYSPLPEYPTQLSRLIAQYKLSRFDEPQTGQTRQTGRKG